PTGNPNTVGAAPCVVSLNIGRLLLSTAPLKSFLNLLVVINPSGSLSPSSTRANNPFKSRYRLSVDSFWIVLPLACILSHTEVPAAYGESLPNNAAWSNLV